MRILQNKIIHTIIFISLFCFYCRPEISSRFGVEKWSGRMLDGRPIIFSALDSERLILNVYSPTCEPCIKEVPAMNILYKRAQKKKIPIYIIVEGRLEAHGLKGSGPKADFEVLSVVLKKDTSKYNIKIPFVIMDPAFNISKGDGPVTGTPETLFFRMKPMILEYNLVGPISTYNRAERLNQDTRLKFALRKI